MSEIKPSAIYRVIISHESDGTCGQIEVDLDKEPSILMIGNEVMAIIERYEEERKKEERDENQLDLLS